MKKLLILFVALPITMCIGCGAGTSYELQTFDVMEDGLGRTKVGVEAFYVSLKKETAQKQEEVINASGQSLYLAIKDTLANSGKTPEEIEALAAKQQVLFVGRLTKKLNDLAEQERRNDNIYGDVMDNIDTMLQLCADTKKFVIYRSDIQAQWKEYVLSTSRAKFKSVDVPSVVETVNTSSITNTLTEGK